MVAKGRQPRDGCSGVEPRVTCVDETARVGSQLECLGAATKYFLPHSRRALRRDNDPRESARGIKNRG